MRFRAVLCLTITALAAPARAGDEAIEARYPEGPLWRGDKLYFAEMAADRVTLRDAEGARTFFSQERCGPTAIAPYGDGFLALCHLGARVVAIDTEGRERRRWDRDEAGRPLTNPNDAAADGAGGVYFSDPGPFAESSRQSPQGRIMHLSADGTLTEVAGPLAYPNGVHVRGGVLYVSEHLKGRVLRYRVKSRGRLGKARVFADLSERAPAARYSRAYPLSGPDGLEFGPDGALYVALYGEGRFARLSSKGKLLAFIDMPPRYLTNIGFGGRGFAATGAFENRGAKKRGEVRIGEGTP